MRRTFKSRRRSQLHWGENATGILEVQCGGSTSTRREAWAFPMAWTEKKLLCQGNKRVNGMKTLDNKVFLNTCSASHVANITRALEWIFNNCVWWADCASLSFAFGMFQSCGYSITSTLSQVLLASLLLEQNSKCSMGNPETQRSKPKIIIYSQKGCTARTRLFLQ